MPSKPSLDSIPEVFVPEKMVVEWEKFQALPESEEMAAKELCYLLDMSPRKLQMLRTLGGGPDYIKNGIKFDGSQPAAPEDLISRHRIGYVKADVLSWMESNRASVLMLSKPAKSKVRRFETVADLFDEQAFWVDIDGQVAGFVDDSSLEQYLDLRTKLDIEFLPVAQAATARWSDPAAHRALADSVAQGLRGLSQDIEAKVVASEMHAELRKPEERSVNPR
ncbi:hypothetical protein [Acidovorax soli]|uniref:Uncharacterized protein n=1 Tax=Acidovorax soli TaxID=592050 RepID=A0A1H4B6V3_9BURK|nr:hypothetical protein [Acidovorax soli]SEA43688.1 hypothetical protein SAMN05421875_1138 [Acidovorax soli]